MKKKVILQTPYTLELAIKCLDYISIEKLEKKKKPIFRLDANF